MYVTTWVNRANRETIEDCLSRIYTKLLIKDYGIIEAPDKFINQALINEIKMYYRANKNYSHDEFNLYAEEMISQCIYTQIEELRDDGVKSNLLLSLLPQLPKKQYMAIQTFLKTGKIAGGIGNKNTQRASYFSAVRKLRYLKSCPSLG